MKITDLLNMSLGNLLRRRMRTALTVLGVLIGTASVVIMISLGIGLNTLTQKMFEESGSLKIIEVYPNTSSGKNDKKGNEYIKDDTIEKFKNLKNVEDVSPLLSVSAIVKQGVYEANIEIQGVNRHFMEQIPIGEGKLPDKNSKNLEFIVGNNVIMRFSNSKGGSSYYETGILPDIDFLNKPLFTIFDTDAYYASKQNSEERVKAPKKYMINSAGMVKGGIEDWNQYSYSIYADVDLLKTQLKKTFKNNPIPNQPTTKKNKPLKFFVYDHAIVFVDDMKNVTTVQKKISEMGYMAHSNMEWLEQSNQQSKLIQAMLGGIGAVSLFVAAIGIANTMMMSIYERTKEIGIMKVLGCDMNKIRDMFLIESGFIGLIGGVIGVILSYIISIIFNKLGGAMAILGIAGDLSVIPVWLAFSAIIFAILVGMLAGFFPSLRAMKLSPLSALRNE